MMNTWMANMRSMKRGTTGMGSLLRKLFGLMHRYTGKKDWSSWKVMISLMEGPFLFLVTYVWMI